MKVVGVVILALCLGLFAHWAWRRESLAEKHAPIEYYGRWSGYSEPIRLSEMISRDEAEARAARGYAYLIGYFDDAGRLIEDVKMYRGEVFFRHRYTYFPSGQLKSVLVVDADGVTSSREYSDSE